METVLEVKNLHKSFGNKEILKGLSLSLNEGENLVVLGKSGAGKSVMIKCIIRLIEPDEGSIALFGQDILELEEDELNEMRRNVGFVFQGGAIYDSMTVWNNLKFQLERTLIDRDTSKDNDLIMESLESVGLEDARDKMPSELSGGMRKRLGLARTMVLNPKIIFYDEPTTGLDPVTSEEMSHLMNKIQEKYKTSSIIVTHDMKCARITSNRILMMKDTGFYANGTYSELEKKDEREVSAFFH